MHVYDYNYAMEEFQASGETEMLNRIAASGKKLNTVFDVGANIGYWAQHVSGIAENIHCFEPMPPVYDNLKNNAPNKAILNPFGLSNKTEWLQYLYSADNDRLTTPCLELARENPEVVNLLMVDGESYCKTRNIDTIDLLKIDTEGHEFKVVKGFENMIAEGKISIIQFEYGYANVLTKDLLIDFYRMLIPLGYTLGLQTAQGVYFKDYILTDENFQGPNYVAVSPLTPEYVAMLSAT